MVKHILQHSFAIRDFLKDAGSTTAAGSPYSQHVLLRMSKVGIHAVLLSSTTAKLLCSRSGEYVKVCFITLFEILIISIFSM